MVLSVCRLVDDLRSFMLTGPIVPYEMNFVVRKQFTLKEDSELLVADKENKPVSV